MRQYTIEEQALLKQAANLVWDACLNDEELHDTLSKLSGIRMGFPDGEAPYEASDSVMDEHRAEWHACLADAIKQCGKDL